jgi:hypothetical protein
LVKRSDIRDCLRIFGWPHLRGLGAAGEDAGNQYSPSLIASEAAGRLNRDELIEVEIDDGLESLAGAAVLDGLGQCLEPDSVLGL